MVRAPALARADYGLGGLWIHPMSDMRYREPGAHRLVRTWSYGLGGVQARIRGGRTAFPGQNAHLMPPGLLAMDHLSGKVSSCKKCLRPIWLGAFARILFIFHTNKVATLERSPQGRSRHLV